MAKATQDRITVEALRYYVPIFRKACQAEERILEGDLTPQERNALETQAKLKKLSADKIADLAGPLLTSELNKMISHSHLQYSRNLFNVLYYAGLNGMMKGLRNFDDSKLNTSATNYLLQWFTVYAKRELAALEAPNGISPSRFQKYKKIAAVRKKLSTDLQRDATDQEILEYFHSGAADIKNLHGRLGSSDKRSTANKNITLELVQEQKEIEEKYLSVQLIDPLDDYAFDSKFAVHNAIPFGETIFGAFAEEYSVSEVAQLVLQSELQFDQIDEAQADAISKIEISEYKKLWAAWKSLIKDPSGPFFSFLQKNKFVDSENLDLQDTIQLIESSPFTVSKSKYQILFQH